MYCEILSFFFSSRRRHTRLQGDWSSDVCSSDLGAGAGRDSLDHAQPRKLQGERAVVVTEFADAILAPKGGEAARGLDAHRSEERRVGREWRCRGAADGCKRNVVLESGGATWLEG